MQVDAFLMTVGLIWAPFVVPASALVSPAIVSALVGFAVLSVELLLGELLIVLLAAVLGALLGEALLGEALVLDELLVAGPAGVTLTVPLLPPQAASPRDSAQSATAAARRDAGSGLEDSGVEGIVQWASP